MTALREFMRVDSREKLDVWRDHRIISLLRYDTRHDGIALLNS